MFDKLKVNDNSNKMIIYNNNKITSKGLVSFSENIVAMLKYLQIV